jgi:hypothetical protein
MVNRGGAMQDLGYELPRTPYMRTSENAQNANFGEFYFHALQ